MVIVFRHQNTYLDSQHNFFLHTINLFLSQSLYILSLRKFHEFWGSVNSWGLEFLGLVRQQLQVVGGNAKAVLPGPPPGLAFAGLVLFCFPIWDECGFCWAEITSSHKNTRSGIIQRRRLNQTTSALETRQFKTEEKVNVDILTFPRM